MAKAIRSDGKAGGWAYQTAENFIIHHLIYVVRIVAVFAFYWLPPRPILRPAGRFLCGMFTLAILAIPWIHDFGLP